MKNIIAIGGSNSKNSINKTLATYAANLITSATTTVVDLNDFELPLYSIDTETEQGIPEEAVRLNRTIESADAIVISLAEHNGSYAVGFKNAFDWLSRIHKEVWKNKPMLLLSTSPGGRGGATVLQAAKTTFPHLGGNIIADLAIPSFHTNFVDGKIINEEIMSILNTKINEIEAAII